MFTPRNLQSSISKDSGAFTRTLGNATTLGPSSIEDDLPFESPFKSDAELAKVPKRDPRDRLKSALPHFTRESRQAYVEGGTLFGTKEHQRLRTFIEQGLTDNGYKSIDIAELVTNPNREAALSAMSNLLTLNQQLEAHFRQTLTHEVFFIMTRDSAGRVTECASLFDNWTRFSISRIIENDNALSTCTKYPLTYDQDLCWSATAVCKSIKDPILRDKVEAAASGLEAHQKTGPVYFKLLMNQVSGCSTETLYKLRSIIYSYSIGSHHLPTWNDTVFCNLRFLQLHGIDISEAAHRIYQHYAKAPCEQFALKFTVLAAINDPRLDSVTSLMSLGNEAYAECKANNEWKDITTRMGSAFKTDAPQPPSTDDTKPSPDLPEKDRNGQTIDRNPPKGKNASTERVNKTTGKTEFWCDHKKCQRWGSHTVEDHDAWFKKWRENKQRYHKKDKKKSSGDSDDDSAANESASATGSTAAHFASFFTPNDPILPPHARNTVQYF